jgi:long-chain acyl-CoA synthetase
MILPEEGKPLTAAPLTPSWHAQHTPEAPAIVMGATGETVSYQQLEDRSARLARALRARGLAEGDTVAICMENNRQYHEVAWAAQRSGLRYTAVNSHLRPAEVQYVLDDSGAVALVSSQALADVVTRLDLSVIGTLICADGELPGSRGTTTCSPRCRPGRWRTSARDGRCSTRPAPPGGRRGCASSCRERRSATRRRPR